ncbi:MAG: HNH endonuclease [Chloroflexi bacterium]|nr:HNH endonuclease [Chloroflexota bacterium]
MRVCLGCGVPFLGRGTYCELHQGRFGGFHRRARNPVYDSTEWQRLRRRLIAAHVARHGARCSCCGRAATKRDPLSLDHIEGLSRGGAPYDPVNLRVILRSCNATKGLRDARR